MATYTSHYNLKKPATSDKIRIADFNGNADTIDATMYENATLGAQLKADIGIVENTNTATHNISAGQYVIWKGDLYTASSAISSGATLSNANLTAVSGGGLNALNSNLNNLNNKFKTITSGSLHDIKTTGMYYLTGGVTDKPVNNGGYYSVTAYNTELIVGIYTSTDGYVFSVVYMNNTWVYRELAQNDKVGNLHCLHAWNTTTIKVDIGFAPTSGKSATGILVNGNQGAFALLKLDGTPSIIALNGTRTFTITISGSEFTITADGTLWGITMILWLSN